MFIMAALLVVTVVPFPHAPCNDCRMSERPTDRLSVATMAQRPLHGDDLVRSNSIAQSSDNPRPIESKLIHIIESIPAQMTSDPYNLRRFLDAQHSIYGQVRDELQGGQKESHWMWFIFPQIKGLGTSPTAQKYAITDIGEAKAYLDHSLLGFRLRDCTQLVNGVVGRSIEDIFGYPDHLKFHSSMTLFAKASAGDKMFTAALAKYFHGEFDRNTLKLLHTSR
jgi:uncharacterized protein (DUF1810 family)